MFLGWNDLSLVIRSKVFEKDEMEQIDIHDVKVLIILLYIVAVNMTYVRLHLHIIHVTIQAFFSVSGL